MLNRSRNKPSANQQTLGLGIVAVLVFASLGSLLAAPSVGAAAPTVASISPSSGDTNGGISVLIKGTGFETGATVTIGGVSSPSVQLCTAAITPHASCTAGGKTELVATVPARSASGAVNVVVTNPDSTSTTITNGYTYNAAPTPTITSVAPVTGSTLGGETVKVTGTGFATGTAAGATLVAVKIGGVFAEVTGTVTATEIDVKVPAHLSGAKNVVVTNPDTKTVTLPNGYTYAQALAPSIAAVSPASGSANGAETITITGANFDASSPTVLFGGAVATVTASSATSITVTTPGRSAGIVNVDVVNGDGQKATLANGFTFTTPTAPTITSIDVVRGPTIGGTPVTITGTGFAAGVQVTIGGVAARELAFVSPTQIDVHTPGHAVGPVDIVIQNPSTQSATLAGAFTYVDVVRLDAISVSSGTANGGTSITLTGVGFQSGARVFVNGVAATEVTGTGTSVSAKTPSHAAGGPFDVSVMNPDGRRATLDNAFTFTAAAAPAITAALGTTTGSTNGGTSVSITGTGFHPKATACIDVDATTVNACGDPLDVAASISVTSATAAVVTTPKIPVGSAGTYAIIIQNPDGQDTAPPATATHDDFTYTAATAPAITSALGTTTGSTNGGTSVTITGSGFHTGATACVDVDATTANACGDPLDVPATITVNSATSAVVITPKIPVGSAGTYAIIIQNPDGQDTAPPATTTHDDFTYTAAPDLTISGLSATSGTSFGGQVVTITGTGFSTVHKPTVTMGSAAVVTAFTGTSITVTTPSHTPSTVGVTVTNPDGQSKTLAASYTFTTGAPPVISSVSQTTAPQLGGSALVITGSNFAANAVAALLCPTGPNPTLTITAQTSTSITATVASYSTAETCTVRVTNGDGQAGNLAPGVRFLPEGPVTSALALPVSAILFTNGGESLDVTVAPATATQSVVVGTALARGVAAGGSGLTAKSPVGTVGKADLVVYDVEGQSGSMNEPVTYAASAPPKITKVVDSAGPSLGGTPLKITGTGFSASFAVPPKVTVGGVSASKVAATSDTEVEFVTGGRVQGIVDVTITNPDGQAFTLSGGYSYLGAGGAPAPTIASVTPASGPTAGGTAITIAGANFQDGATVKVGGTLATDIAFVSSTQLTAKTPAGTAGAKAVVVTNPDSQIATKSDGFTYSASPAPTISSLTPTVGPAAGGTVVTISGTGFQSTPSVTFGGSAGTVTAVTSTQITVTTPAHAAGAVSVVVTNPDSQVATVANGFTYQAAPAPVVSAVSPATGGSNGGTTMTITGSNFVAGATVTIGGSAATSVIVVSGTQITAVTPGHAAGVVDVVVRNADGQQSTLASSFTYTADPAPTLTSLSVSSGSTSGGTSVTITGTNFATGATVTFGGVAATGVTVNSATSITATTPSGSGTVDVRVTNPDGQLATLLGAFTYDASAPVITAAQIQAANEAVRPTTTVTRDGDDNTVRWSLAGISPAPSGVDIWRATSPFVKIATLEGGLANAGVYVDGDAPANAKYLVTVWYTKDVSGGFVGALNAAPGYVGLSDDELASYSTSAAGEGDSDDGLPWWAWLLIALGILLIILLVVGLIMSGRRSGGQQAQQDYNWDDEPDTYADEDEAYTAPVSNEAHNIECPRCDHEFVAHGQKPLHTTCPNCGVAGVLR